MKIATVSCFSNASFAPSHIPFFDEQMLYLDSLEVDEVISDCNPRVDAWDSSLISKVKKKDRISPGVFGKLQVCNRP
jgi:hypothetical protein